MSLVRPTQPLLVVVAVVAFVAAMVGASSPSRGASSSLTVNFNVLSSTVLDTAACQTGTPGVTDFGTRGAGESAVIGPCTVRFGSTNNTSTLSVAQSDASGKAMWTLPGGALDTNFGTGGKVTLALGGAANDKIKDMARALDGNYVSVSRTTSPSKRGIIAKWSLTGAPLGNLVLFTSENVEGRTVVPLDDGRYLVGGTDFGTNSCIAMVTGALTLDTTWNGDGMVCIYSGATAPDINVALPTLYDLAIQSDGKIVVSGASATQVRALRLNPDGSLDTTFATSGVFTSTFAGGSAESRSVQIDAAGSIYLSGMANVAGNGGDFSFVKLTPTGALDVNFDGNASMPAYPGNGQVTVAIGAGTTTDRAYDMSLDAQGRVLAVGLTGTSPTSSSAFVRLDPTTGDFDPTFKGPGGTGNGKFSYSFDAADDNAETIVVFPRGELFVGGQAGPAANLGMLAVRMRDDGSLDTSFSSDGWDLQQPTGSTDESEGGMVGADGSMILGGHANNDTTLYAWAGTTMPDYQAGVNNWTTGTGMVGMCLRAVGGGATTDGSTWTPDANGNCTDGNTDPWNAVPTANQAVARGPSGTTTNTASIAFGMRIPLTQTLGSYSAPVTFTVTAP